jgi:hypothetical protein
LILVFGISISSLGLSKDALGQQNIQTAEGRINAIDTFKSTVTVKSLLVHPIITYKDVTLFVGPNTKITRQGGVISIFDLTMGAPVSVRYAEKEDVSDALLIAVTAVTK